MSGFSRSIAVIRRSAILDILAHLSVARIARGGRASLLAYWIPLARADPVSRGSETPESGPCWCRWFHHSGRATSTAPSSRVSLVRRSSAHRFSALRFTV